MKRGRRAFVAALGVWGLALASVADEAATSRVEPSLSVYRQLDARGALTEEQRAFFEPYFVSHAARLQDMRARLNTGELSYVGALFEGRALERELTQESVARLDDEQRALLGEIRDSLRSEFRALFFKEEHAWLLRVFGHRANSPAPTEGLATAADEKS